MEQKKSWTYYHVIWSTQGRQPAITPAVEGYLFPFIRARCRGMGVPVHALNGTPDHVHFVCSLPPRQKLPEVVEKVMGASARFVNELGIREPGLQWQPDYDALTVPQKDLPRVVRHVESQKQHHAFGAASQSTKREAE